MAAKLSPVPRFVFTILEPLSLLGGYIASFSSIEYFISSQLVRPYQGSFDDTSLLVARQLGNCYALLGLLGVFILNTTSELKVVNGYIWALWLGDIGHVALSLHAMGLEEISNVTDWSATIWGNTAFTIFLFLVRSLYLLGAFGEGSETSEEASGKRSKQRHKKTG